MSRPVHAEAGRACSYSPVRTGRDTRSTPYGVPKRGSVSGRPGDVTDRARFNDRFREEVGTGHAIQASIGYRCERRAVPPHLSPMRILYLRPGRSGMVRGGWSALWGGAPRRAEAPSGWGAGPGAEPDRSGVVGRAGRVGRRRGGPSASLGRERTGPHRTAEGAGPRAAGCRRQHGVGGSGGNRARSASVEGGGGRRMGSPYIQEARTRPGAPGASGRCGRRPWTTEEVEPCVRA